MPWTSSDAGLRIAGRLRLSKTLAQGGDWEHLALQVDYAIHQVRGVRYPRQMLVTDDLLHGWEVDAEFFVSDSETHYLQQFFGSRLLVGTQRGCEVVLSWLSPDRCSPAYSSCAYALTQPGRWQFIQRPFP